MILPTPLELGAHVSEIVSAYVANHTIDAADLPGLVLAVQRTLATLSTGTSERSEPEASSPQPAVSIKKSVFPDYIVCLEDGQKLKMLKRHLKAAHNMEPDQYRAKWGLPDTYPMVAPNFAEIKSGIAKKIGLGRRETQREEQPSPPSEPVVLKAPTGRGGLRRRKSGDFETAE
jgi:predicted transcriptional regulator